MRYALVVMTLLLLATCASANRKRLVLHRDSASLQNASRLNTLQFELGGNGLFYSLNMERKLWTSELYSGSFHYGISYYPRPTGIIGYWFPIGYHQMIHLHPRHEIVLGVGYTVTLDQLQYGNLYPELFLSPKLGYRFTSRNNDRWQFGIHFTPMVETTMSNLLFFGIPAIWNRVSPNRQFVDQTPFRSATRQAIVGVYPLGGISLGYRF